MLVKRLQPSIARNSAIKDKFLECFFHMILTYYRVGLTKPGKDERDKAVGTAAAQLAGLEKSYGDDFGNEAMKKRVNDLLAAEPALKAAFEASRKKK